jgi:hypothetical protein
MLPVPVPVPVPVLLLFVVPHQRVKTLLRRLLFGLVLVVVVVEDNPVGLGHDPFLTGPPLTAGGRVLRVTSIDCWRIIFHVSRFGF